MMRAKVAAGDERRRALMAGRDMPSAALAPFSWALVRMITSAPEFL